jgi:phage tail-like protein
MATPRERPYSQFSFYVLIDRGDPEAITAGFQEVTGLGTEITVAEYRNGNEKTNAPRKINGMYKVPDVTLKRGVIGEADLYEWMKLIREGKQSKEDKALRNVTIQLRSEDRATVAVTWELVNARPLKYTGPSLNGKGTDVAVEELVLSCEDILIS